MLFHPEVESFQATVDQVAVKGTGHCASGVLQEPQPAVQVDVVGCHRAHDDVTVTVHVLGQRVVGNVGTQLQWTLHAKKNYRLECYTCQKSGS